MKLLISAYACAPNHGSEHAVGWNWTTEARRLGHEVWVMVSPAHRDSITRACHDNAELVGIRWIFPEVKGWALKQAIEPNWERTYNLLWQRAALRAAWPLHQAVAFDAVHHLTWCGIRAPTFLGALKIPLIVGPIGGGETSPASLRDKLGLRGRLTETIRDLSTATVTSNPLTSRGLRDAAMIFVHTRDTLNLFSGSKRDKSMIFMPVAVADLPTVRPRQASSAAPRFLYAGRLLYWKGVHIALRAFAELRRQIPGAHFTIVGDGPDRNRLEKDVKRENLEASVTFIARLPQAQLFKLYENHDLFLFPSLHDSGGFVVLEALSHGMPVVCLDLGGPRDMVTSACGIVVSTTGRNTAQVAAAMATQVYSALSSPRTIADLSAGAYTRARAFILAERVEQFYDLVAQRLQPPNGHYG